MKGVIALFVLLLFAPCAAFGHGESVASRTIAERIRQESAAWDAAYTSGHLSELMGHYEEGAVSMPPGRPPIVGRAAIEADLRSFFANNTGHHTASEIEVHVDSNTAIERAHYDDLITSKIGAAPVREIGKHIVVYRHQKDGSWKVMWEIWNLNE